VIKGPQTVTSNLPNPAEQLMLDIWKRRIAFCQKYRKLLPKKDQQFVDKLAGRTKPSGMRRLNALIKIIQRRDPRSSGG
jgi:hypothetical protein